jgi:capsular exopolysaccharide synthesis family protein
VNRDLKRYEPWPVAHIERDVAGAPPQSTLDFPTLLKVLWRWRGVIAAAAVAGLAIAIVYVLATTPRYRATVSLEVNPPSVQVIDEDNAETPGATASTEGLVATQAGLLKSTSLAADVAEELNLAKNPEVVDQALPSSDRAKAATAVVRNGLDVALPKEGTLIHFSFTSTSPQLAARIANGIAEGFINSNLQRRFEASAYARKFLQQQIAKTRRDLEQSERRLVGYAQAQGIINTGGTGDGTRSDDTSSPQGESLLALNKALAETTARRIAAEGAYRAALSSGMTAEQAQSTQALRQSRAELEAEYQDKRVSMKPDHPEMVSLKSKIDELDRQINRESADVSTGRINSLLSDYRAALAAERSLQGRVAQLKGAVLNLRDRNIQYTILQRDVDTNRSLYDALLQRYKQIGVAGGIGTSPVSIVDRAEVPSAPFEPNLPVSLLLGLGAGLLLGVAAAFALELITDIIRTRDDVRSKLGLPCLGAIPKQPGRRQFIEALDDPSSAVSESYSDVVASLRFSTEAGVPKSILITSARASEGKSSAALALSLNFARRGYSVLLVDADLRKPAFRTDTDRCSLAGILTGDPKTTEYSVGTQYDNLRLLPAGAIPPNPADLLSSNRFKQIIEEATQHFDLVVIDTPPVLAGADVLLMLDACEDVMLVIEAGKTRTFTARDAVNRLMTGKAHILGVTLAKSSAAASAYSYGYGYGYGRKSTLRQGQESIVMIADQTGQ